MQTVDLSTVQHVTISYETASLGERLLATLIDSAIVGLSYFFFTIMITSIFKIGWVGYQAAIMGFILPLVVYLLYHFLSELLMHGQSLGKKILHLQVVRLDGTAAAPADYLLRSMLYFIDLVCSLGILGGLFIYATPKRQRLGDLLAGTCVIRIKTSDRFLLNDILKISSLEDYKPLYPNVRQFTEDDMLLIKNTITRTQRYPNEVNKQLIRNLAARLAQQLDIKQTSLPPLEFLNTLIRDYIVLTR